jgi:hypothetical protein
MTDGQLDGRTQRCEELSGKDKALSNGVQSDAIDAGPRRVARKRGVAACLNPALHLTAAASRRFVAFRLTRRCGRGAVS